MLDADEEARALAYRQREQVRCALVTGRDSAFHGNDAARRVLEENWMPVILAREEARGFDEIEECT